MNGFTIMFLVLVAYCGTFGLGYFAARKSSRRVRGMLRRVSPGNALVGISEDGLIIMDFPEEQP